MKLSWKYCRTIMVSNLATFSLQTNRLACRLKKSPCLGREPRDPSREIQYTFYVCICMYSVSLSLCTVYVYIYICIYIYIYICIYIYCIYIYTNTYICTVYIYIYSIRVVGLLMDATLHMIQHTYICIDIECQVFGVQSHRGYPQMTHVVGF